MIDAFPKESEQKKTATPDWVISADLMFQSAKKTWPFQGCLLQLDWQMFVYQDTGKDKCFF